MKNITRIGLILTMAILTSCSLLGSEDQDETETEESGYTEREFYDKIQRSLNSRNWQVAIGNLQLLESQFPFGKYAEQAAEVGAAGAEQGEGARTAGLLEGNVVLVQADLLVATAAAARVAVVVNGVLLFWLRRPVVLCGHRGVARGPCFFVLQ